MLLLQQLKSKAKRTSAVKPLNLPRSNFKVKPGDVCYVAGWGKLGPTGKLSDTLQEVELTVQEDQKCETYLKNAYDKANQICAGDPKIKRASFRVSWVSVPSGLSGRGKGIWDLESQTSRDSFTHWLCSFSLVRAGTNN